MMAKLRNQSEFSSKNFNRKYWKDTVKEVILVRLDFSNMAECKYLSAVH